MRAAIDDAAITVTTATRSEDEVRTSLGADAKGGPAPAAADAAGADGKPKPAATVTPEQEADSDKPDPEVSEAARTLRKGRADSRKAKIQDEINALTRKREEERAAYDRERAERLAQTPPAERKPAADAAKPTADGKDAATPKFAFQTYEQYQVDHPEAGWEEYIDARSDAKYAFNRAQEQVVERAQAEEREVKAAFTRADSFQKSFQAEHPDYETKLKSLDLTQYGVVVEDGVIVKAPHQFIGVQRLLLRAGEAGPGILYYLADHPDDVARLLDRRTTPGDLLEMWGEIKYAAKASATATPKPEGAAAAAAAGDTAAAAAAPARPRTSAPAPLTAVPGGSSHSRTPQQIADGDDDADEYINARQPALLKRVR